ncbi:MAG TPA: ABC transporter permease [Candidatus Angelobacter sp.]|nr:ABC transporter permease [Candidatus Angelobacter sp.]
MIHFKLLSENMKMAFETIRTHKVRSFLTVLGVVIGVTVAIVVTSTLLGFEDNVQESLNDFGINNLFIFKFDPGIHFGRLSAEERTRKSLTWDDGMAIREQVPSVKEVSIEAFPKVGEGQQPIRTARYKGHELSNINYTGANAAYAEVQNVRLKEGRFYTEAEDMHREDVAVIGYDVEKTLYPGESAVGKPLDISGVVYTVIGVLEKKKNTTVGGGDNDIQVPYRSYRKHYPQDDEHFITAAAYPGMKAIAEDQIRGLLRQRRHVAFDKPDNFGISSAEQAGKQFTQIFAGVVLLVVSVGSIGLLVGGVGVMNIMLMGVTERTREIGVRKAIGARKRDIIFQFITEAMTLTGVGGAIGVIVSLGISFVMRLLSIPSSVPVYVVLIGLGVSSSVGLFFGIYPAIKAARLDPVVALRYE